jgi:Na+/H+ antiporter NhaC
MKALSPLLVFIALYLVTSIIAGDFYKVPITVAFLAASVYAVAMSKGPLRRRIDVFSRGAGSSQMMLMIWIFILAGAFAYSAEKMGAIQATVDLCLSTLPPQLLLAGLFLTACFISLSVGTSVGTIVALVPIATGVAEEVSSMGDDLLSVPLATAVVVGGTYFGDNLSFISDTTIVATQTQGCRMVDKFRLYARIVVPAAILVLLVYVMMGM